MHDCALLHFRARIHLRKIVHTDGKGKGVDKGKGEGAGKAPKPDGKAASAKLSPAKAGTQKKDEEGLGND